MVYVGINLGEYFCFKHSSFVTVYVLIFRRIIYSFVQVLNFYDLCFTHNSKYIYYIKFIYILATTIFLLENFLERVFAIAI